MTATFAIATLAAFNLICAGTTEKTLKVLPPEGARITGITGGITVTGA